VDHAAVVEKIHAIAEEFAKSSGRTKNSNSSSFLETYGFSSLDALEFLLLLEEELGVTFEDEDLNEDILTSDSKLADYITAQLNQ
jgi:acyl carrier protein